MCGLKPKSYLLLAALRATRGQGSTGTDLGNPQGGVLCREGRTMKTYSSLLLLRKREKGVKEQSRSERVKRQREREFREVFRKQEKNLLERIFLENFLERTF